MQYRLILFICFLFFSLPDYAHPLRKKTTIVRTTEAPKIDALPNDKAWERAIPITDFVQHSPNNGAEPTERTEVRLLYDDRALYILALLYDSSPDSIFRELGDRDSGNEASADLFSMEMNPYSNGLSNVEFMVSAAGVQMDSRNSLDSMFKSWDAVWKSDVAITEEGWIAEMEIPFSALRFPRKEIQMWEINFYRLIKRKGEGITWNFVDRKKKGWLNQAGELHGIRNVDPPLRLSFMPYMTTYYSSDKLSFKGGMDIKYGLDESFTLDMMLIPDFGQIRGDDNVLNLTVVETKYDEKRQFFTEGRELFTRGDVFYSRRIGGQPYKYGKVPSMISPAEKILKNPSETYLYNATKISGNTPSGWGVGFLNAVTQKQEALVRDTLTGISRHITTQDVSNYNLLVINKDITNESYISWVNTNVVVPGDRYMANVSGFDFKYRFTDYALFSNAFLSYLHDKGEIAENNQSGYRLNLNLAKLTGVYRFALENKVLSKNYNPRDFGYIEYNNLITNVLRLQYFQYTPSDKFNEVTGEIGFYYENLYNPFLYSRFEVAGNLKFIFPTLNYLKFHLKATPVKRYDHFEPRVTGWKYKESPGGYFGTEYSSDYRKKFSFKTLAGYFRATEYRKSTASLMIQPHFRLNDKLSFDFLSNISESRNAIGFVDKNSGVGSDSIFFGRRNITNVENVFSIKYSFSNKSALNVRLRHYWSNVRYRSFYLLQPDGELNDITFRDSYNANVNLFNSDFSYIWHFLPGSEMRVVWKNYYSLYDQNTHDKYLKNLREVFSYSILNSLSLRVIYYIDYENIKKFIG